MLPIRKREESDFSFDDSATPQNSTQQSRQVEKIVRDRKGDATAGSTY